MRRSFVAALLVSMIIAVTGTAYAAQDGTDKATPKITAFRVPSKSASLTVPITSLKASDKVGVTGYMVSESSVKPSASAEGWNSTAPAAYTFTTAGKKKLYAWVKDEAGNVSSARNAKVTVNAQVAGGLDGAALYASGCASCHGPLASSTKKGSTASQIQDSIDDIASMSGLKTLTSAEVEAIATALSATSKKAAAGRTVPLPAAQQVFAYGPAVDPLRDMDPALAMPIGVGPIAKDEGDLDMRVSAGPFAGPVDISVILYAPSGQDGKAPAGIYTLQPGNTFASLTGNIALWKSGVTEADEAITNIQGAELIQGTYMVILGISPVNSHDIYYHWITSFTVR